MPYSITSSRMYAVAKMSSGMPDLGGLSYYGFVHIGQVGDRGAYLFSGTQAQLSAIASKEGVIVLAERTDTGGEQWTERALDILRARAVKVNEWLSNEGKAPLAVAPVMEGQNAVNSGMISYDLEAFPDTTTRVTCEDAVTQVFSEFYPSFDWKANWVRGPEDD
jgi:hypothetical protein